MYFSMLGVVERAARAVHQTVTVTGPARRLASAAFVIVLLGTALNAPAQDRTRPRIDVEKYVIQADLDPAAQRLKARAEVHFIPSDDALNVTFELNNNLSPTRITNAAGQVVSAQRMQQDGTLRVNFEQPLAKDKSTSLVFEYEGTLASGENQPIEGLKLAYVGDPTYLLYPGRWFPVSGYQTDRFAADITVSVPQGMRVIGPGRSEAAAPPPVVPAASPAGLASRTGAAAARPAPAPSPAPTAGRSSFRFVYDRPAFPGSIAAVKEQPQRVTSGGASVDVYFRGAELEQAAAYGEAAGKIFTSFTSRFGPPPVSALSLVQIETGSVNGYTAPGVIFLSPRAIGSRVNHRMLANQVSRQWWRHGVSPATRADLWLVEGLAAYSELLYMEEMAGKGAIEQLAHEVSIDALANDTTAIARATELEEFSYPYDAVLGKKGAMVLHMLRWVIGDDPFFNGLRQYLNSFNGRAATTDNLRASFEKASGKNLEGFFIQWVESTGAPEFKADYTIMRASKGFKIVGKIKQDMDTFRMPVEVRIDTDGEPEIKRIDVSGTASDFIVETFGRPRKVTVDPENRVLKYSDQVRLQVAITRGQQAADIGEYEDALKEYQKALDINKNSSLAHFRIGEVFFVQNNYQSAANAFREALNGDQEPRWTTVWSHLNLGKIFDITGQRERALNEYRQAIRTKDNTQGAQDEAERYTKEPFRRERRGSQS